MPGRAHKNPDPPDVYGLMSANGLLLSRRPAGLTVYRRLPWRWTAVLATIATFDAAIAYVVFSRGVAQMALGTIIGTEALALCVLRPRWALLGFVSFWGAAHVLLSNGEGESVGGASTSISQLIGVTVVLGFGITVVRLHARRSSPLPFPLRTLATFGLLYLIAEALTPMHSQGLSDLVKLVGGLVLALMGYYLIDSQARLIALSRAVAVAGVLVATVAIAQFATGSSLGLASYSATQGVYRATSVAGGANGTADFLLVVAGFLLLRYTLRRDQRQARGDLAALAVVAMGIVATFTRADVLALVAMLLLWAALWQIRSVSALATRLRIALTLAVVAFAVVQAVGGATLVARIEGNSSSSSENNLLNGRGAIWSNELKTFESANLGTILIGSGAHTSYTNVYIPQSFKYREFPPHDLFLWLAIETGFVGLAVYSVGLLALSASFLRVARRRRFTMTGRVAAVAFATTLAFTFDSVFHNTQVSTGSDWYFMLFIGATLRMVQQQSWGAESVSATSPPASGGTSPALPPAAPAI
jgi:O-antigen ligase